MSMYHMLLAGRILSIGPHDCLNAVLAHYMCSRDPESALFWSILFSETKRGESVTVVR